MISLELAANIQEVCSASNSLMGLNACDKPDPKGKNQDNLVINELKKSIARHVYSHKRVV